MTTPARALLGALTLSATTYTYARYRVDLRRVNQYWATLEGGDTHPASVGTPTTSAPYAERFDTLAHQVGMSTEHRTLSVWEDIAPTLQTGDLLFLRGTGDISRKICILSYLWSGLQPAALHFSHVALVVRTPSEIQGNAPYRRATSSSSSKGSTAGMTLHILEAIDNKDVRAPDFRGVVRYDQVQVVAPEARIFGVEGERPCYSRCAVRRLRRTASSQPLLHSNSNVNNQNSSESTGDAAAWSKIERFLNAYIGRSLDKNPNVLLAYLHPRLYPRLPSDGSVTCAELVLCFYEAMGWRERPSHGSQNGFLASLKAETHAPITATPWGLAFYPNEQLGIVGGVELAHEIIPIDLSKKLSK